MGTLSYSPSASSLADMPAAPYPVGSSVGTLAPSSSSSDLRPEVAGATKETAGARISSLVGASSESVGSVFSKSGSLPPPSSNSEPGQSSADQSSAEPRSWSDEKGKSINCLDHIHQFFLDQGHGPKHYLLFQGSLRKGRLRFSHCPSSTIKSLSQNQVRSGQMIPSCWYKSSDGHLSLSLVSSMSE